MRKETAILIQLTFVFAALATLYFISDMTLRDLKGLLLSYSFLFFCALMALSELLRSVRLKFVTQALFRNGKISILSSLLSRMVGNLAGTFTPSGIGSVPAQVTVLSSRHSYPIEVYIGSGIIVSMVDAIAAASISIAGFLLFKKTSVVALISSTITAILWFSGVYVVFFKESFMMRAFDRIYGRFSRRLSKPAPLIKRIRDFQEGVRLAVTNPMILLTSFILGVISFLFIGYSIVFASGSDTCPSALEAVSLGSMTYVLSFFPTPGGSGFYEIGLAETLGVNGALRARISILVFYITTGLVSLLIVTRDFNKFKESLKKSIMYDEDANTS